MRHPDTAAAHQDTMAAVYAAPSPDITPTDRLGVTVFFAICAHLIVVLGVTFVKEDRAHNRANTLDVVLVQRKSEEAPERADFLAQAHQIGGGESDAPARPSTPLPAPMLSNEPELVTASRPMAPSQRVEAPPDPQPDVDTAPPPPPAPARPVVSQTRVATPEPVQAIRQPVEPTTPVSEPTPVVKSKPDTPEPAKAPPAKALEKTRPEPVPAPRPEARPEPVQTVDAAALVRRSLAMASLNAEVDKRLEAYAKRPRRKWISASTRAHRYAAYMEAWRAKVERVGNLNYPDEARRRELSGALLLDVAVRADGQVDEITIRRSSGHKVLDDAAIRIVKLAAPFARLPENIREETDILHIERTWRFLSGNRFASR